MVIETLHHRSCQEGLHFPIPCTGRCPRSGRGGRKDTTSVAVTPSKATIPLGGTVWESSSLTKVPRQASRRGLQARMECNVSKFEVSSSPTPPGIGNDDLNHLPIKTLTLHTHTHTHLQRAAGKAGRSSSSDSAGGCFSSHHSGRHNPQLVERPV